MLTGWGASCSYLDFLTKLQAPGAASKYLMPPVLPSCLPLAEGSRQLTCLNLEAANL